MEEQVRERIAQAIASKKLNPNSLAKGDVNLSRKIYKQLTEGKTLTYSVIEVLLEKIPDLSAEWLFRGTGRPFLTDQADEQQQSEEQEQRPDGNEPPRATANGDGAIAIAGDGNITIPKQVLDMLAEKDRQLAAKDDIIKQFIMRK